MTEQATSRSNPSPVRRKRRPHPAANARIIATGLATTFTLGTVAVLGAAGAAPFAEAAPNADADLMALRSIAAPGIATDLVAQAAMAPVPNTAATVPARQQIVVVVRRIHRRPATPTTTPPATTPARGTATASRTRTTTAVKRKRVVTRAKTVRAAARPAKRPVKRAARSKAS